jgi:hypothetical protein
LISGEQFYSSESLDDSQKVSIVINLAYIQDIE